MASRREPRSASSDRCSSVGVMRAVGRADDRANGDELVHGLRHARQELTDLDALDVGLDRLELAADFRRRVHLQVVHVLVRGRAAHIDHDDGLVRPADPGLLLGRQQLGQAPVSYTHLRAHET